MMHGRSYADADDIDFRVFDEHAFDIVVGIRYAEFLCRRVGGFHARGAHRNRFEQFRQRFERWQMGAHCPAFTTVWTVTDAGADDGDLVTLAHCGALSQRRMSITPLMLSSVSSFSIASST